MLVTINH